MIILGVLLVLIGLALWLYAGLLPVARILRSENKGIVTVGLVMTWMGSITFSNRLLDNVRDARLMQDPNAPRKNKVELKINDDWQEMVIRFTQDVAAKAQFVGVLQQYLKAGGPRVLALPLRGRFNMIKRFLLFFPLGTASIFTGIMLIIEQIR